MSCCMPPPLSAVGAAVAAGFAIFALGAVAVAAYSHDLVELCGLSEQEWSDSAINIYGIVYK